MTTSSVITLDNFLKTLSSHIQVDIGDLSIEELVH